MDKETREFLDRKFDAIDEKFAGIDQKFTGIDQKFTGIDQKFAGIDQKFAGIDEKFEETKRHFDVIAEGLRTEIRQVAEGHDVLRNEMQVFRNEVKEEFKEVRALIKFSYAELDQRIRLLEDGFHSLKTRLERLEARPR